MYPAVPEESCGDPTCGCGDHVVFEGTTADLLSKMEVEAGSPDAGVYEADPIPQEEEIMTDEGKMTERDMTWLNVDMLKMALEIEASKTQRLVFYIDVGNLPKAKAEQYVKDSMSKFTVPGTTNGEIAPGHLWIPRKEGGRGTEVTVVPGRVTLEGVLDTAQKLKEFITK